MDRSNPVSLLGPGQIKTRQMVLYPPNHKTAERESPFNYSFSGVLQRDEQVGKRMENRQLWGAPSLFSDHLDEFFGCLDPHHYDRLQRSILYFR